MKTGNSAVVLGLVGSLGGLIGGILAVEAQSPGGAYAAVLFPLNVSATSSSGGGDATFTVTGDRLTIRITATGVPASMEHMLHFHGFVSGDDAAACPTMADDTNGDGIIDILEVEPVAGVTMVPFQADPVSMAVVDHTYPTAGADGTYSYEVTVSLAALEAAFTTAFPEQDALDLERRVVFLHGVPETTPLAPTVASLGDIPAQMTIPIACGEIRRSTN